MTLECPQSALHTPHPTSYLAHAAWADEMLKTHRQKRCPGCGLWAIWEPKPASRGVGASSSCPDPTNTSTGSPGPTTAVSRTALSSDRATPTNLHVGPVLAGSGDG